ncbi:hypothetical protein [Zobellia alginiliquefaciens]|nr:hypothetical protein [Zobellia alginiliquefaciens]
MFFISDVKVAHPLRIRNEFMTNGNFDNANGSNNSPIMMSGKYYNLNGN